MEKFFFLLILKKHWGRQNCNSGEKWVMFYVLMRSRRHKKGTADTASESVTTHVVNSTLYNTQCSRASRVLGNRRSSSLANTTSLRDVLLRSSPRSLRLGTTERTACSNSGHISSDVPPRSETTFAFEPWKRGVGWEL
jgi:hypothetical protein